MNASSKNTKTTSPSRIREAGSGKKPSKKANFPHAAKAAVASADVQEQQWEPYQERLRVQRQEFDDTIAKDGRQDGVRYAKHASYRELKAVEKMMETFDTGYDLASPGCDDLACAVCETEEPDRNTQDWVEESMSTLWAHEDSYVRGFIQGMLCVLKEIDALPNPRK